MSSALGAAYMLDEPIGSGASGQVWRGHVRAGGGVVAVKMLKRHLARDRAVVTRFLRERDILVGLDHPNVVSVIDLVAEGGRLGIVMQLVAGGDLRRHVEQAGGRLSPEAASALLAQVAAGLGAAHAAGVVHRDLKPENVLVDRGDDGSVLVRITDFGVSHLAGQAALTRTSGMVGTPLYAAPEVATGSALTSAADIYALGVIAYELVSGRPPFAADNPWALMRLHVEGVPTRPAGVPDALWAVIASCLAKGPGDRPTAAAAAATFRALSDGEGAGASERRTVPPAVEPLPPGPRRPPARRRWALALALALGITVLAAAGLARIVAGGADDDRGPSTTTNATSQSGPATSSRNWVSFTFDDLPAGAVGANRQVADTSANGNVGGIRVGSGGRIAVIARTPAGDKAIKFPDPCRPGPALACPRAIVQTADPSSLEIGDRDFAYGSDVLVLPAEVSPGAAILHKGRITQARDSEWTLQLEADGRASCVAVAPGRGRASQAVSAVPVADGAWHRVTCTRTGTNLTIDVDGGASGHATLAPAFRFDTDAPLRLGGKSGEQDNAQFSGALDNVVVSVVGS